MSKFSDIGNSWGQQRIAALRSLYESKRLKASGDFGRSLELKVDESQGLKITFLGNRQIEMMTSGRAANKNQSPEKLRAFVGWAGSTIFAEWVKNKGLSISPFAVAWKVARDGVKVPNRFNDGKILEETFSPEAMKDLTNQLGVGIATEFKSLYLKAWQ
jgi:hypothetical protein